MDKIIEWITANPWTFAIILGAVVLLIGIIIIMIKSKKSNKEKAEYEKITKEAPVVSIPEEEKKEETDKKEADLAWVKGEDKETVSKAEPITEENVVEEKEQPKKTVKKAVEEKTEPEKTEDKIVEEKAEVVKKVIGKWVVKEKGDGEYMSFLYANNGEMILSSEIYSTADGAKKGIDTIKKNIMLGNFKTYRDKNSHYYFKLKTSGNKFLCSGETYQTESSCISSIESVKRFCDSPIKDEIEQDITFIKYEPKEIEEVKTAYKGKWSISSVDKMHFAQLFASNGELLLSSEAYSTVASAKSAIATITINGLEGNFIIDSDKNGRYFFKLRNKQKSTLCVGETYPQLSSCQSAIESVRRFLNANKSDEE